MLELIFVLIVIGILAAIIIPSTRRNSLQEAAIQLVAHIRYTQHLAMLDDRYDANDPEWFKSRWQLIFQKSTSHTEGKYVYTIFSDHVSTTPTPPDGLPNLQEIAMDPSNSGKYLSGGTSSLYTSDGRVNKKMNLGLSYGIETYDFSGGCDGVQISFDHLGRPMYNKLTDYTIAYKSNELVTSTCNLTLSSAEGNISIVIEPETGYTYIR